MKQKVSKIKRATLTALAVVCAFSSVSATGASALKYSSNGHSVTVTDSETTNGYTLKLSSQLRTVSTSKLSGYSRLAKIEAAGYASCIKTSVSSNRTVFINAYY